MPLSKSGSPSAELPVFVCFLDFVDTPLPLPAALRTRELEYGVCRSFSAAHNLLVAFSTEQYE